MANGDAAAADGMDVISSSADYRTLYDEENKSRDYIAGRLKKDFSNISGGFVPISAGGTGATTAAAALTALGAQPALGYVPVEALSANAFGIRWAGHPILRVDSTEMSLQLVGDVVNSNGNSISSGGGPISSGGGNIATGNGFLVSDGGFNTGASSNYHAAYWDGDHALKSTPSARRTKQNIKTFTIDPGILDAIQPVHFRYKHAVRKHGADAPTEIGFVADEFVAAGLAPLTWNDDNGELGGLHYEKVTAIEWSLLQNHEARIRHLETENEQLRGVLADLTARLVKLEAV